MPNEAVKELMEAARDIIRFEEPSQMPDPVRRRWERLRLAIAVIAQAKESQ